MNTIAYIKYGVSYQIDEIEYGKDLIFSLQIRIGSYNYDNPNSEFRIYGTSIDSALMRKQQGLFFKTPEDMELILSIEHVSLLFQGFMNLEYSKEVQDNIHKELMKIDLAAIDLFKKQCARFFNNVTSPCFAEMDPHLIIGLQGDERVYIRALSD